MCCNYCYHFSECKKAKKINTNCCPDCAEYEFCPFVLNEKSNDDYDSLPEPESDTDMFEGDEI